MSLIITLDEAREKRRQKCLHVSDAVDSGNESIPNEPHMASLIDQFEEILDSFKDEKDSSVRKRLVQFQNVLASCTREIEQLTNSAIFLERVIEIEKPLDTSKT